MNKAAELVVGATIGAFASELLKVVIEEAKKVFAFGSVSKELARTMEELLPIVTQIESMKDAQELKTLKDTIDRARVLVRKCSEVQRWEVHLKSMYTRKVEKINREMVKFCQVQVQLILLRNQGQYSTITLEAITNCLQTISMRIDLLNVPAPAYRNFCSVPKLDDKRPVGLDWPLLKLKNKLLNDSLDSLLVSAPPGCGKTRLVTQLCHDQDIKGKFKHIFYSVVSSDPKFRVIVQHLYQHNGYQELTFENNPQADVALTDLLEDLVHDGPTLLVLDDVWDGADSLLKYFLIKLPGYKILVTSRFDLPEFGYTYRLKPLEDKDAEALLFEVALIPLQFQPEYEDLLQKILKRCNGLPLLIEVIGVPLKGRPLYFWKGQVESWSEWETILGSGSLLTKLQPSFSALEPHLKECFMDMGSFLEDQKIRASIIIDIWVELYGKGTSSCSGMAYMKYLNDLASQNLVKLIHLGRNEHEDGFYNEIVVTQHDILRELAIHQSKSEAVLERKRLSLVIQGDNYPNWCLNQSKTTINARFLFISTDDLFSSSWVEMDSCHFPNVEALVLYLSSSNYELPSFIAGMKKLKVVIIVNHGLHSTNLTNLSCLSSLPKLKRIRLEKVSITFLDILQLELDSLKKLSLFMCSFGEDSCDQKEVDVSKALSSLQEIEIDYCYDLKVLPYWISKVVSLEKLSITNCNKLSTLLPEAIGNLSKLQMLRLCSCINISELPETTKRLSNLEFLDISDCLGLRKLPLEIGSLQKLRKIYMRKCSGCELPDSVRKLKNLEVKCDEETAFLWERLKPEMRNLRVKVEETEHNLNLLGMF